MSLADVGIAYYPQFLVTNLSAPGTFAVGNTAVVFDSDNDRIAYVGRARKADTISVIYFRTGTVTTGCTLNVNLETVTNGRPSGSLLAAGATVSVVVADGDDNVWKTATIGTPPTVALGDEFAIVFTVDTAGATPNMNFQRSAGNAAGSGNYPLCLQDTGAGTWAQLASPLCIILEYGTAGIVHHPGLIPQDSGGSQALSTGGTEEDALAFQLPQKARCIGIVAGLGNVAAGANFTVSLWDATGDQDAEALAQITQDGDYAPSATVEGLNYFFFDAAVTLSPATQYYAGIRADTANALEVLEILAPAGVTNAMRGFPIAPNDNIYKATRQWTAGAGGAWSTTTTTLPCIGLIIDQLDDGASAGGGMRLAGHGGLAA